MPIPLWALPVFRRLYQQHLARTTPNPLKLVFPSREGTVRYPNNVRRAWNKARGTEFAWVTLGTTRKTGAQEVMDKLGPKATAATGPHDREERRLLRHRTRTERDAGERDGHVRPRSPVCRRPRTGRSPDRRPQLIRTRECTRKYREISGKPPGTHG